MLVALHVCTLWLLCVCVCACVRAPVAGSRHRKMASAGHPASPPQKDEPVLGLGLGVRVRVRVRVMG